MSKEVSVFWQKIISSGAKIAFYVSKNFFWRYFSGKKALCWIIFGAWADIFRLVAKVNWQSYQKRLLRVHKNNLRRNIHLKFFYPSRTLSEQFLVFSRKFLTGLSKLHSICPKEHFETKLHFIGVISPFRFFSDLEQNFFGLLAKKNFRQGDQNCSLPVRRILLMRNASFFEKQFFPFSDFEQDLLGLLAKNFRQSYQICVLHIHEKNFWRNTTFSWKDEFFSPFWDTEQVYFFLFKRLSTALSKLHSTCAEEQSEENHIFWRKNICFFHIWALRKKNFRLLAKKFSSSLSK